LARIKFTKQNFLETINKVLDPEVGGVGGASQSVDKVMEELRKKAQGGTPLPAKETK